MNPEPNPDSEALEYLLADETVRASATTDVDVETVAREVAALESTLRTLGEIKSESSFAAEIDCAQAVKRLESLAKLPQSAVGPLRTLRNYELLDELGSGGMGVVFRARHAKLDKQFAVKVLSPKLRRDQRLISRFHREIRAAGKIEHENVVCATDADEVEGVHFLAMELISGVNLAELVKRRGPLPIAEACEITRRAAIGLQAIHDLGLVHRDIKPSNLMLTSTGQIKVMDLGLALLQDPAAADQSGEAGQAVGTISYMAPEQRVDSREVDARADLYSLGCSLHYLLVGRPPSPAGPRSVDHVDIDKLLDRLLSPDPTERCESAAVVAAALQPHCQGADLMALATAEVEASMEVGDRRSSVGSGDQAAVGQAAASSRTRLPVGWVIGIAAFAALSIFAGLWSISRSRKGELVLRIGDPEAKILVDGSPPAGLKQVSATEVRLELPVGSHELEIRSEGRDPWRDRVTIANDQPQTLVVQFETPSAADAVSLPASLDERERGLAQWVLERGGSLRLYPRGDVKSLSDLPDGVIRIQNIVVTNKMLADADAVRFTGLSNLQGLQLSRNRFSSAAVEQFSKIRSLRWLYLPGNRQIDDAAADYWPRLDRLEAIDLSNTRIGDATIERLTTLSKLRELRVSYTRISDPALIDLAGLPGLVRLDLSGNEIGDTNLRYLQLLPELRYLHLNATNISDQAVRILIQLSTLTELELKETRISDEGLLELRQQLPKCRIKS